MEHGKSRILVMNYNPTKGNYEEDVLVNIKEEMKAKEDQDLGNSLRKLSDVFLKYKTLASVATVNYFRRTVLGLKDRKQ